MKKNVLFLAIALLTVGIINSCDSITQSVVVPKMDSEDAVTRIVESINKNIDLNEWKIYGVRWSEIDELTNEMESFNVDMVDKNDNAIFQSFTVAGENIGFITDPRGATGNSVIVHENIKGITPDMINHAVIKKQFEQAMALIPEGYEFKSVDSYSMAEVVPSETESFNKGKNIGAMEASFTFNVIESGKEVIESAGKEVYQYYEIDFDVMPDGSVEIDE